MAEAEDVLLSAAEHGVTALRRLWRRHAPADPAAAPGTALDDVRAPLALWVEACGGGGWPLCASDPPVPAVWAERLLRDPPPWRVRPAADQGAGTDGATLYLPRRLDHGDRAEESERFRVTALGLARRALLERAVPTPADPLARDLHGVAIGAWSDAHVAEQLPGLRGAVIRARAAALAARPPLDALTAPERAVEELVRRVLAQPAADGPVVLAGPSARRLGAADWAAWAEACAARLRARQPGRYRGLAPVAHWGVLRRRPATLRVPDEAPAAPPRPGRATTRALEREVRSLDLERLREGRAGIFMLPFGDPQLALDAATSVRRPRDDDDAEDVDALASELERLEEVARVRTPGSTAERLVGEDAGRAPSDPGSSRPADAPATASDERRWAYPEWDFRTETYRFGHCVVRERVGAPGDPRWLEAALAAHRPHVARLRKVFEAFRPRRVRLRRQLDGPDLDLDATVERFADRLAGRTPSDRIYAEDRPRRRDVSVLLLLDASGSTDAHVGGGKRVIDLVREAALLFGEAVDAAGDRCGMHAFSGSGPRGVRVARIRELGERQSDTVRSRIAGLLPDRSTRLGAALRHATAALAHEPARVRLLLLLSDGRPNDEDEYEGRYGIEDTRQAVAEARRAGVHVFCLALDRQGGAAPLERIFGPQGFAILWSLAQLPERLPDVYRRLTQRHRLAR